MLLRTDVPMPVLEGQRNLTFESGIAASFGFSQIELRREDVIAGLSIVSATMEVMPHFGGTVQFTKTVTTIFTADGVILDTGASSGVASARFDLSIGELTSVVPRAFLVTVTDTLGRQTRYDSGYLVPILTAPAETAVDHVVISPTELLDIALGTTVQMGAAAYDASDDLLPGRVLTFSSSDELIATVNAVGTVSTIGLGSVTITAASGGKQAHAQLSIAADVLMEATFTDADGTHLNGWACDTGQVLTVHAGSAEIQGNRARTTVSATWVSVATGSADGRFTITLADALTLLTALVRLSAMSQCLRLQVEADSQYLLYRDQGFVTLLSSGPASWTTPSVLGIVLAGSGVAADLNGDSLFSGITESFNATEDRVGFLGFTGQEVESMSMVAP